MDAHRHIIAAEQLVDALVVPARLPELHRVPEAARQRRQKVFEAREVHWPAWRQLVQHRREMRSKVLHTIEETRDRFLWIFQLLHMGEKATGLDGIQKPPRRLVTPLCERLDLRQPVEAVVNLDSIKTKRVMSKPVLLRQLGRVELAAPVLILPTRASDSNQ